MAAVRGYVERDMGNGQYDVRAETMGAPIEQSRCDEFMDSLEKDLHNLRDLAGNLGVRLSSVRLPVERDDKDGGHPEQMVSPLANRIRGAIYLVASTRADLLAILETIEV